MRYLFISPHVDDSELMAGATMAKLIEEGNHVEVITLSSVYNGIDLSHEFIESMKTLGVSKYHINDFNTRLFNTQENDILQYLFSFNDFHYVFCPSIGDFHSDHSVTAKACNRAFKHTNLISWMPEWNQRVFVKNYFVKVNYKQVVKKLSALDCYKSQQAKNYFTQDVIVGSMAVNGMMCNTEYAEAFNVINLIR